MKSKILPTLFQGNYKDSLGDFSKTSYGVLGAERFNLNVTKGNLIPPGDCINVQTEEVSGVGGGGGGCK